MDERGFHGIQSLSKGNFTVNCHTRNATIGVDSHYSSDIGYSGELLKLPSQGMGGSG